MVERPKDQEPIEIVHMFKDKGILSSILPEYLGEWAAEKIKREGVTLMPLSKLNQITKNILVHQYHTFFFMNRWNDNCVYIIWFRLVLQVTIRVNT